MEREGGLPRLPKHGQIQLDNLHEKNKLERSQFCFKMYQAAFPRL